MMTTTRSNSSSLGLLVLLGAGLVATGGCSAPPEGPAFALGQLGPSPETTLSSRAGDDGTYFFGAGDSLGREVFRYYVASLDLETADQRYATGESGFVGDE